MCGEAEKGSPSSVKCNSEPDIDASVTRLSYWRYFRSKKCPRRALLFQKAPPKKRGQPRGLLPTFARSILIPPKNRLGRPINSYTSPLDRIHFDKGRRHLQFAALESWRSPGIQESNIQFAKILGPGRDTCCPR